MPCRETYLQRKAEHKCVQCGQQDSRTLAGHVRCVECQAKQSLSNMADYQRKRESHLCVNCGQQDRCTLAGHARCERCWEKVSVRENCRADNGQCIRCGDADSRTKDGKLLCGRCAEKRTRVWIKRRDMAHEKKVCRQCLKQDERTLTGKSLCTECAARASAEGAERNRRRMEHGRCTRCGKQDAYTLGGRSMCAECAEKQRIRDTERTEQRKEYDGEKYRKRAEAGLCASCGSEIPDGDSRRECPQCRTKRKIRHLLHYQPKWQDPDLCKICHRYPKLDGKQVCQECEEKILINLGGTSPERNHPWRMETDALMNNRRRSMKQNEKEGIRPEEG